MTWGIWAIIAIVLLILETLTVDFTFLMLAGGALAAMLTALATSSLVVQIVVFSVVSVLLLVFIRPWARNHVNDSSKGSSNVYALAGKDAVTLTAVNHSSGRVKIGGDVWSAATEAGEIGPGIDVVVKEIQGVTVIVAPK
ncbi:membrane protein implicated in regulation of membrane protease activity [Arcanobacterium pluranimalium]|uniref:NfeD family protein n=1 Tax=Arcanobacterium pluranimalium TaxID=108028 RepID=UPI00195BB9AA|nr:NfeD family protein [Arcanobacterium pluranimalium]MBM7825347.1 membrane protein implicated in regulation of membrane protease activity [Arcanobacterium pluranimalium]